MKTLQFRITLLSDVILNQKSATEGSNSTLDFIPGNCFLGIVASRLYTKVTPEEALDLFHNGKYVTAMLILWQKEESTVH